MLHKLLTCSVLAVSLSLAAQSSHAPIAPPAAASDSFRQESLVFERYETTYRMQDDGTGERSLHVVVRIQSQGAAQQFGVLSFPYASATETLHIVFVRVHKPDGVTVDTPVADAIDMSSDVTRTAPLYSDLKEKHLPVRSLSIGDTLEYQLDTTIDKPETPGQFWGANHFTAPGTFIVLSEKLTLEVPADKYVQVWSPNHKPQIARNDGVVTYIWDVPQLIPSPKNTAGSDAPPSHVPKDPDQDEDSRNLPSVAWTTFHNWAEVGDWYRSLSLQRAQPTDALRARAQEIVKDAKTPEDQIRALYDFVALHTRYVGIDFGVGRYQPHAAADVLADEYGDCKDKDTLLEALLRSLGFDTAPALIGVGVAPAPDVPTPAVFNHVITTVNLPSGRIWLDSTPQVGPFRYLIADIRGEKALVVPATGPATLESTPAQPPYPLTERFEATGALDADGKMTASMTSTFHDDNELIVRAIARAAAPADWDKVSQYISANTGFSGTTSNTQFRSVEDLSAPFTYTYDYTRHPFGDWDNLRIVPLFPALEFTMLNSDSSAPADDIQLGSPRTLVAVTRIRLPEGFQADLPDPIHVRTGFATFDKTYHLDGNTLTAERIVVVLKKKINKDDWKSYQQFTQDIKLSGEPWIQLTRKQQSTTLSVGNSGGEKSSAANPPAPAPGSSTNTPSPAAKTAPSQAAGASPRELMQSAFVQIRAGNPDGAKAILDQIKAEHPDQEFLWSGYGTLAAMKHNYIEAAEDFRKEFAAHPDNADVALALAETENKIGDAAAARDTLEFYLDRQPGNLRASLDLANLQTTAKDYDGALKTLQAAAAQNPAYRAIQIQICETLLHLNRVDEAATAAKAALDGADDPETLNDAAYQLSLTGVDLPDAETGARKAVDILEQKSASLTADQANKDAFAQSNLLIASWDTLGWILFREDKPEQARPLIDAAWLNSLHAEVGDHLGQIDEALGHKHDAAHDYSLAKDAASVQAVDAEISDHIEKSLGRLNFPDARPGLKPSPNSLQDLRTFHVPRPAGASGWGAFRFEIAAGGSVLEALQMSGDTKLASVQPALLKMQFRDFVPPGSKAHLLRSAVVSCSDREARCDVVIVPDGGLQTERQ